MSHLCIKPIVKHGRIIHISPKSADWSYVGFDLYRLAQAENLKMAASKREICLVLVTGVARVSVDGVDLGRLGERMSPFEGKPWAVYVPAGSQWNIVAETALELAICSAPGDGKKRAALVINPQTLNQEVRGKGTNTRYATNILHEGDQIAASLLVVEAITPGGHTSSYPPHKHDTDNLPHESALEETYYHRFNPPQGFAFQRVFTDADANGKRTIDEVMVIENGDAVMVPQGYHPCATCHGYDLYYLNVMAGPKRTWKIHNAIEHEWILK
jgi:5-deoxy-glucuronate isomerase